METCGFSVGLSGNVLKIIAMISMLIDHVGYYLFPSLLALRAIGRLAFPIFAYMIAEGCTHTRNRWRYFLTVAGIGIVCQTTAFLVAGSLHLEILCTFALAIATVFCLDTVLYGRALPARVLAALGVLAIAFVAFAAPLIWREQGFTLDYGVVGVYLPVLLYYIRGKGYKLLCETVVLILLSTTAHVLQWFPVPIEKTPTQYRAWLCP